MKKRRIIILLLIIFLAGLGLWYKKYSDAQQKEVVFDAPVDFTTPAVEITPEGNNQVNVVAPPPTPTPTPKPTENYDKVTIKVPFIVQAPNANWDPLHEEACEEASLLMIEKFMKKKQLGNTEAIDKEIIDLVNYEESKGYGVSITLDELNTIAKDYLGMNSGRIEKNVTAEKIKSELKQGKPVVIPAAGKILPNPNFRNGGPVYHMLVVVGYDKTGFISNDPGTRKGEGYHYRYNDLVRAIHDWDSNDIMNGEKSYLVFD